MFYNIAFFYQSFLFILQKAIDNRLKIWYIISARGKRNNKTQIQNQGPVNFLGSGVGSLA